MLLFSLPAGTYALSSDTLGFAKADVTLGEEDFQFINVNVDLGTTQNLIFQVKDQNGDPITGDITIQYKNLDNGNKYEFGNYCAEDGISHITCTTGWPVGNYEVTSIIYHNGAEIMDYVVPVTSGTFSINGSDTTAPIVVESAKRTYTINVQDQDGAPVENVNVEFQSQDGLCYGQGRTDSTGKYNGFVYFDRYLANGTYNINNIMLNDTSISNSNIPLNVTSAMTFEVSGTHTDINITVVTKNVTLTLLDDEGTPIENAEVYIKNPDQSYPYKYVTDSNGQAKISLADGTYNVTNASKDGAPLNINTPSFTVDGTADVTLTHTIPTVQYEFVFTDSAGTSYRTSEISSINITKTSTGVTEDYNVQVTDGHSNYLTLKEGNYTINSVKLADNTVVNILSGSSFTVMEGFYAEVMLDLAPAA